MIRGMVERLASRLRDNGADVDGWRQLVRSYVVLNEKDRARAAVIEAHRVLAGAPDKIQRLDDEARRLGVLD